MEFFLKIQEILLKTGGIFKNRWNQKPVEFFLSKKTGGIFLKTGGIFSLIFFTFFSLFYSKTHIFPAKVKVMCVFFIVHYDTMNNSRKSYHQGVFV